MEVRHDSGPRARVRPPVTIWARDCEVSTQVQLIYDAPGMIGLLKGIVASIAARESRDIVKNIRELNEIAATPAAVKTVL
jgi:hypothetical protein